MTTLQFTGTDYRDLIDVLIQAVELTGGGDRPTIEVNGKVYAGFDLLKVAALLPDDDLLPHHQAAIEKMFQKKQRGYRRTAYNLAHRSNQIASQAKERELRRSPEYQRRQRQTYHASEERRPFRNRGLSERTIDALLDCGIDAPERLLSMTPAQLSEIPGIGKASLGEIMRYREPLMIGRGNS